MFRKIVPVLVLCGSLALAMLGATPASADQCYSSGQTRQMVQSGQAIAISGMLDQIDAIGKRMQPPMLCKVGGRLAYLIDLLAGGNVIHVQVDAQTGAINY